MGRMWFAALFAIGCVTAGTTVDDTGASDDTSGDTDETELDTGWPAEIVVSPAQITWDAVGPGCADEKTLTVSNVGGAPLRVSAITIGPSPTFQVAGDFPTDVPAEGEVTFPVTFTPAAATSYSGSLRVFSDAPGDDEILVLLTGVGGQATVTDTFSQPASSAVDILWVLDTSCSMSGLVAELESQADEYVAALLAVGADFQMGVTTVDMDTPAPGNQGTLAGDPVVLKSSTMSADEIVQAFDDAVDPTALGSGTEKALGATYAALQTPGHAVTAGLVRADARLVVVLVGDEDDQSGQNGTYYAQWIEAYKPTPARARIDALVPMSGGTNPFDVDACIDFMGSPRIEDAVEGSGGRIESMCQDDIGAALGRLGRSAAGLFDRVTLSADPANGASGMTVTVDGDAVSMDPFRDDGWAYDFDTNEVRFYGSAIPASGEDVVVTYPVDATCP